MVFAVGPESALACWGTDCPRGIPISPAIAAMESTGIYWIPALRDSGSARGFDVVLVNARYAKNVPWRKTDVSDVAWLRLLHSYYAAASDAVIATLRAYLRQRGAGGICRRSCQHM